MKVSATHFNSERGSATIKFAAVFFVILLIAHAAYNYIPVAYNGAAFKQEMDTAVVKGLAAAGQIKPLDAVTAHVRRAATDYKVPADAVIEIKPNQGQVTVHASYVQPVNMLPFGIYKYNYTFNYTATPSGYLLKE